MIAAGIIFHFDSLRGGLFPAPVRLPGRGGSIIPAIPTKTRSVSGHPALPQKSFFQGTQGKGQDRRACRAISLVFARKCSFAGWFSFWLPLRAPTSGFALIKLPRGALLGHQKPGPLLSTGPLRRTPRWIDLAHHLTFRVEGELPRSPGNLLFQPFSLVKPAFPAATTRSSLRWILPMTFTVSSSVRRARFRLAGQF